MSGDLKTIYAFVRSDVPGISFSYLRNYTSGTAFFVSGVLEDVVLGGDCNSTITFVPIPNDEGQYPTSFGLFNITCTTGLNESLSNRTQYWRVAGMLIQLSYAHATLLSSAAYRWHTLRSNG